MVVKTPEQFLESITSVKDQVIELRQSIDPKEDLAQEFPKAIIPYREIPWCNIAVDDNLREIEIILGRVLFMLGRHKINVYEIVEKE